MNNTVELGIEKDEKVERALKYLEEGKTRYQASRALGYGDIDGMDRYLRRRGYLWNSKIKIYEQQKDTGNIKPIYNTHSKIKRILDMFNNGISGEDVAKFFKFKNYQELASYLKDKGYYWDANKELYVRKNLDVPYDEPDDEEPEPDNVVYIPQDKGLKKEPKRVESNEDLLELLKNNKEMLLEILNPQKSSGNKIPRYLIKGFTITKSVYISAEINRMIVDFSEEKNVSQKDIFQVALIEFFRKYGYRKEVDNLLNS